MSRIAQDPTADLADLFAAAAYAPDAVLENTAFKLALVANPELPRDIPAESFARLVRQPNAPERLLEFGLDHRNGFVGSCTLANPNLTSAILDRLEDDLRIFLEDDSFPVDYHRSSPGADERLAGMNIHDVLPAFTKEWTTREAEVGRSLPDIRLDERAFLRLGLSFDAWFPPLARRGLLDASYLEAVADLLFGEPESGELVRALAASPNLPSRILVRASTKTSHAPLFVTHPNLPSKVMADLVREGETRTQAALARNPSLPPDLQRALFEMGFARSLAPNPSLDVALLPRVIEEGGAATYRFVLARPGVPDDLVAFIRARSHGFTKMLCDAYDPSSNQDSEEAADAPPEPVDFLLSGERAACTVPLAVLAVSGRSVGAYARTLVWHEHPMVRLALALNPDTPVDVLEQLRQDADVRVCSAAEGRSDA